MRVPDVPIADLTKLEAQGISPVVSDRVRGRMFRWFVQMGHRLEFKEGSWNSHGDLRLMNMPTIRDFKLSTTSIFALRRVAQGDNHGTEA